MTSRERAEALVKSWAPDSCQQMVDDIQRAIDAAVIEAVAAERKACVKAAWIYSSAAAKEILDRGAK